MGDDQVLQAPMVIVGMVNGMIGGLILILPLLALGAGYILSFIVLLITGILSFYSCYLCVIHMGDQPDLDYAILRHFNGNKAVKIFYDLCVWLSLIFIDMLYFQLIQIQWDGLVAHQQYPICNPLVNAVVLFSLVFVLKYFQFGASLMAYGIISIITYVLFLMWVVVTSDQGNDKVEFKSFGTGAGSLAAAMGQAYSIQSFFIPVLKKNPNPTKYVLYTMIAYIIGGSVYFYIAYMGSFGIWHRSLLNPNANPDLNTIQNYFMAGAWEVKIIQCIYLIHLYSVFPQFLLISKKRLFSVIGIQQSHKGHVSISQIVYFVISVGICLTIGLLKVSITDIIDINGAVIGFFFIYFLPAVLHIKCMYFSKGKRPILTIQRTIQLQNNKQNQVEIENKTNSIEIQGIKEKQEIKSILNQSLLTQQSKQTPQQNNLQIQLRKSQLQNSFYYCNCVKDESFKKWQIPNLILIGVMILLGAFIMVNGIYTVATN